MRFIHFYYIFCHPFFSILVIRIADNKILRHVPRPVASKIKFSPKGTLLCTWQSYVGKYILEFQLFECILDKANTISLASHLTLCTHLQCYVKVMYTPAVNKIEEINCKYSIAYPVLKEMNAFIVNNTI